MLCAAPARAADLPALPPAFIDVGSAETLRDEAVAYADRIWRAGGYHTFDLVVPDALITSRDGRGAGVLDEFSKECVNSVSPGTRTIARRSWHSELVGIQEPRDELRR
ncbi:hypothetical protein [Streptomyces sp. NPDC019793]|uniref:hypothetical protein n=1 Tax=unclassified Streptomyces TaxID=2593676 RepID=UPI0033CE96BB